MLHTGGHAGARMGFRNARAPGKNKVRRRQVMPAQVCSVNNIELRIGLSRAAEIVHLGGGPLRYQN